MFDADATALLRAVLNEVCENVPQHETGARAHVASKILEAAARGETSAEDLKRIGRGALDRRQRCGSDTGGTVSSDGSPG